jgi:conjugal transfer pilin signal peptidase TrbI
MKNRFLIGFTIAFALYTIVADRLGVMINITESLPERVFIVFKGQLPTKYDQLLVYKLPHNERFAGKQFIKRVGGMAGDYVVEKDNKYVINGKFLGTAKTADRNGLSVEKQPARMIPKNQYFAYSTHKDSYDSKYKEVGLIRVNDIVGVAYAIL